MDTHLAIIQSILADSERRGFGGFFASFFSDQHWDTKKYETEQMTTAWRGEGIKRIGCWHAGKSSLR